MLGAPDESNSVASQADLLAPEPPERAAGITMLDTALDDPAKPWCYLAKSTTVIGVPFQPDVTQVTFDGALYTKNAELCFFYGQPMRPLLARQKNFLEGWLPVVQYAWSDGPVSYDIEMFAAALDGESADNTVNFVRLRARNTGHTPVTAVLGAMMRDSAGDYRLDKPPFDAGWRYEMSDQAAFRGDALVYAFSGQVEREAVPGTAYSGSFAGRQYSLTARSEVCVTKCQRELAPGEASVAIFKMPRVPVPRANEAFLHKLAQADYQEYRNRTVAWWKNLLASGAVFEFPRNACRTPNAPAWFTCCSAPGPATGVTSKPTACLSDFFLTGLASRRHDLPCARPPGIYQGTHHGQRHPSAGKGWPLLRPRARPRCPNPCRTWPCALHLVHERAVQPGPEVRRRDFSQSGQSGGLPRTCHANRPLRLAASGLPV